MFFRQIAPIPLAVFQSENQHTMKTLIEPIAILILLSSGIKGLANDAHLTYIAVYKNLAIEEMYRTGIPASIKLAQGVLESNAGRSELATRANNHFGIKCGNKWEGPQHYREDDDWVNGRLIKSCFRVFNSPEDSYRAHSAFLQNNPRYAFLFDLGRDYKAWAHGLLKASYATDPHYPIKLINLIERYSLYEYDGAKPEQDEANPPFSHTPAEVPPIGRKPVPGEASPNPVPGTPAPVLSIRYLNDIKTTEAGFGESLDMLSKRTRVSNRRILKYNDHINGKNQLLEAGTRVFLQPKRNSYRGKELWHIIEEGEGLYDVSQKYGIKMKALYKRNLIPEGEEPITGSRIKLKGGITDMPPTLRNANSISPVQTNEEGYLELEIEARPEVSPGATPEKIPVENTPPEIETPNFVPTVQYHEVQQGDTLWNIARRYNLSLDSLRQLNNLISDQIKVGMQLRIR